MQKLEIGMKAPVFRALDSQNTEFSLADFRGKYVVVYFYPKDNTPGCTLEAQDFSTLLDEFSALDCVVIGISPDSPKSHNNFVTKYGLRHVLLCDSDKSIASSYGAYGEKMMYGKKVMGIIRSSFLINPQGNIAKTYYNIRAKGHAQEVLDDLRMIQEK